jgi:hypothetical protein
VPAASLALRGREEGAASGKRWEGDVLELNPDYDAVKPSVPSATIGAFALSAKTASGAACCDDVPGVGTYDPSCHFFKKCVGVPVFHRPGIHLPEEAIGNIYNPCFSLVERSVTTPKFKPISIVFDRSNAENVNSKVTQ